MSNIEWTEQTDNIIVPVEGGWFCVKVSPGCKNCYAERLNQNSYYKGNHRLYQAKNLPELMLKTDIIEGWARRRKPRKVFVNSMTDTFAEFVPPDWKYRILDAAMAAPNQTFQFLTKRAKICYEDVVGWMESRQLTSAPSNIWLGFSAENQEWFDSRSEWMVKLSQYYGFVIWASLEPLLGPINFKGRQLDWVVAGGESGPNARPAHLEWARSLRDQSQQAGIPFFWKQWGAWLPFSQRKKNLVGSAVYNPNRYTTLDGEQFERVGKKRSGRLLDGVEWSQFPLEQKGCSKNEQ